MMNVPMNALSRIGFGALVIYIATFANVVLASVAAVVAYHAMNGQLQAQEDFEAAVLIFIVGVAISLVCLVTLIITSLKGTKGIKGWSTNLSVLALLNLAVPWALVLSLKWVVRG